MESGTFPGFWVPAAIAAEQPFTSGLPAVVVPPPTGQAATDTAHVIEAVAQASAIRARTVLQGGVYYLNATVLVDPSKTTLEGPGANLCTLWPCANMTGDVLRVTEASFVSTIQSCRIGGFTIDGTNAGTGAVGLHYGDAIGGHLDDLIVQNFTTTGAIGIHIDNVTNWTERLLWTRVWSNNNKIGVLFDKNGGTTSWAYHRVLDLRINANAGQTGLHFANGGGFTSGVLNVIGNYGGASTTFLLIDGNSNVLYSLYAVQAEMDSAGSTGISVASGSSLSGNGSIDLSVGTPTNTNSGSIQFGGWFNCPGIHVASEGVSALGGVSLVPGPNDPTGVGIKADASNNMFLFCPVTGGLIVLRPNGPESGTGQWYVDTNGNMNLNSVTATAATAGANGDVPAQVVGYLEVVIAGTTRKIPYYAV